MAWIFFFYKSVSTLSDPDRAGCLIVDRERWDYSSHGETSLGGCMCKECRIPWSRYTKRRKCKSFQSSALLRVVIDTNYRCLYWGYLPTMQERSAAGRSYVSGLLYVCTLRRFHMKETGFWHVFLLFPTSTVDGDGGLSIIFPRWTDVGCWPNISRSFAT